MNKDKEDLVFRTYEKRAEQLIDKGYRGEVWYIGYKLLSDWTLLSRIDLTNRRVLNVGCFEPIDELFWARKVKEWVGIDFSPKSIRAAKEIIRNELSEKLAKKIKFEIADARDLPFKNESFDIAVSFSTIEHIPGKKNREKAIKEMVRVTKKGGYLVITVPNRLNFYTYREHKKLMKLGRNDFGYECFYTPWQLRKLLVKNELKILYFISELWLPGGYPYYSFRIFNKLVRYFGHRIGYLVQKEKNR